MGGEKASRGTSTELARSPEWVAQRPALARDPKPADVEQAPASVASWRPQHALLVELQRHVQGAVAHELEGTDWTAEHCPYIEQSFEYYRHHSIERIEVVLSKYVGVQIDPNAVDAWLPLFLTKVRGAVARWRAGGEIDAPPAASHELEVLTALGDGDPIEPSLRTRLEAATGQPLGHVRMHTDAAASRVTSDDDARALAVGEHVAFAAGQYRPGTLAGDALIAHELAHTVQQRGATRAAAASAGPDLEHAADGFAAHAVARLWGGGSAARSGATMPRTGGLQLQRCRTGSDSTPEKKDAGVVPSAPGDAGTSDAAPVDAAAPPGKRSWVRSEVITGTKANPIPDTVKGGDFKGNSPLEDAIKKYFPQTDVIGTPVLVKEILQAKENPSLDPTKIGDKTKIHLPHSIELPIPAERIEDPDDPSSVNYETWQVEGASSGSSLEPSHPSSASGVTIGRGYDMKARTSKQIVSDLIAAGVPKKVAKLYGPAATLTGSDADTWVKDLKKAHKASEYSITADAEKLLFENEYQQTTDATVTTIVNYEGFTQTGHDYRLPLNFAALDPKILALLVDLRFRGNLNSDSWAYLRPAVMANKLADLQTLVADVTGYMKNIDKNKNRYEARCRLIGATPQAWPK